jgi:hypothetical protein
MLLSFAQFEREVTAERIRDKIAASKAKGMWMGGIPPLGYEPDGRSLKVVEAHADIVRDIFERYVRLGNVRLVAEELAEEGIVSPVRVKAKSGVEFGGVPLSRGQIYGILNCPTYVGEVHHKGQVYPGKHAAIVDGTLWTQAQEILRGNLQGQRSGESAVRPSMLAGKVVDADGSPLLPVHACKGKVRYRYYVSRALHRGEAENGMRIPARELETAVTKRLAELLEDGLGLIATAAIEVAPGDIGTFFDRLAALGSKIAARDLITFRRVVSRVTIHDGRIEIECSATAIAGALGVERCDGGSDNIVITCEVRLSRSGRAMRLIQGNGAAAGRGTDASLVALLIKARRWWSILREGELDVGSLARVEGVQSSYVTRVVRLAFLAPAVVEAILAGAILPQADSAALTATDAISPVWVEQRIALLPQ